MHTCMNSYIKTSPPLSHRPQRKGKMIFIHSFNPDISIAPPKSTTTQRCSRPQYLTVSEFTQRSATGNRIQYIQYNIHGVSEKTVQNCFCQNFVKFLSILMILGIYMKKSLKFYATYTFSPSPHARYRTNLLNTKVPNFTVSQENCETIPSELCSISINLIIFGRYMTK